MPVFMAQSPCLVLRRHAIDTAVKEINDLTDIFVTYEVEKQGRKVHLVKFSITHKGTMGADENVRTIRNIESRLSGTNLNRQGESGKK